MLYRLVFFELGYEILVYSVLVAMCCYFWAAYYVLVYYKCYDTIHVLFYTMYWYIKNSPSFGASMLCTIPHHVAGYARGPNFGLNFQPA